MTRKTEITRPSRYLIAVKHEGRDYRIWQPHDVRYSDAEVRAAVCVDTGKMSA